MVRGGGLRDPQEMWAGVREGYGWCCVSVLGTRLGGLGWKNRERRSVGSLPGFLAGMACGLSGGVCWIQRLRKSDESGWEVRKGWSVGPTGDVGKGKEGCSWGPVAVLGRRLGDWV